MLGFTRTFNATVWPAIVVVKIEGRHNFRQCWPLKCNIACEWWDPSGEYQPQGTEYWNWTGTFTNSSNPYIAVEIYNIANVEQWTCYVPGEVGGWNNFFTRDNLFVNMFQTNSMFLEGFVSYFSSKGPSPQNPNLIEPLITAPGVNICAARAANTGDNKELICGNDNYIAAGGTSNAAPHVTGLIALLREANPQANYNLIVNALKHADKRIENLGYPNIIEGYGEVNAQKAINYLILPKITISSPENKTYSINPISLTISIDKSTSWIGYSLDNKPNVTITGNTTLTNLGYKSHNIIVYANSTFGSMSASNKIYFTTACTCTPWKIESQDDYKDCRYGDCIICTITILSRVCSPSRCDIQYRRAKACDIR